MWTPIPVCELELTHPVIEPGEGLGAYRQVKALARWQGTPVGWLDIPVSGSRLGIENLAERVLDSKLDIITRWALADALLSGQPPSEEVVNAPTPSNSSERSSFPSVSVVVCTRERPEDLRRCLTALQALDPAPLELIVVDNAPVSAATKHVVEAFRGVRYIVEPRPGLDWARNRGILDARGDVVAFADDDVIVDTRWAGMLQQAFGRQSCAAVTGLIAPYELTTESQMHFELHGGFGRGCIPKWEHYPTDRPLPWRMLGTGILGSGANMAFRRDLFARIGLFLPQLDTGTVTEGGGDLEIFYRTLKHGYPIAYEPRALAWHRHRQEPERLVQQIGSWGVGTFAFLEHVSTQFPDEARNARRYAWYWRRRLAQRVIGQYLRPERMPAEVRLQELRGALVGKARYREALARARQIEREFGPQPGAPSAFDEPPLPPAGRQFDPHRVAVRSVDLANGAQNIDDVAEYLSTRVFLNLSGRPLGHVDIENRGLKISRERLVNEMLGSQDAIEWLRLAARTSRESTIAAVRTRLTQRLLPNHNGRSSLRPAIKPSVSIVLATCDRPQELLRCLKSLTSLPRREGLQILVVDNRPEAPETARVVAQFPTVTLVSEPRRGLSYARNAGFARATGEIIVCTDDDVTFAQDWLDTLLAPFRRNDVDIVCGNVLPMALEVESQLRFEQYGGLGKGHEPKEVDQEWFFQDWTRAVSTWSLGATANTAFRAKLLRDPDVGQFEELLGPGVPSGVGEDTYFFYRALRHGYKVRYEPSSVVWHEHRRTHEDLKRQLFGYSTGHVAYHLHTLLRDRDFRVLPQLLRLASWHAKSLSLSLRGKGSPDLGGAHYPLELILTEIRGNLLGPWALWRSHRVVRERGRSEPLPAVPQNAEHAAAPPLRRAE